MDNGLKIALTETETMDGLLIEGNNLVIRIHGLNFPSGKATIQPEYFSLLTKLQEALRVFPEKHIVLEGHTDSRGNATKNKALSEERAIAVREYVIANMGKSREQITAIGYGSAKPVASNQTQGVRCISLREGDTLAGCARVTSDEPEPEPA